MDVYVSELFPNPVGKDAGNEWIEICNKGSQSQSLTKWKLQDASAKSFTVGDVSIAPQSCVVFGNTQTKISLNNDKEIISLLNNVGVLKDSVSYNKAVKDNYALARVNGVGELQATNTPTKGEIQNIISTAQGGNSFSSKSGETVTISTTTSFGAIALGQKTVVSGVHIGEVILIGICVAGILAALFIKVVIELRKEKR